MEPPDLTEIISRHHSTRSGMSRHYLTLYSLVLGVEAKRVFEFGTGFSTYTILKALGETGGQVISCDTRSLKEIGEEALLTVSNSPNWTFFHEPSHSALSQCTDQTFDLVLHDGSHTPEIVSEDLRMVIPRMKQHSLLLVHDTEHPTIDYGLLPVVHEAVKSLKHSKIFLPYGYGLTVIRIEEDFGNGSVELTWKKQSTL